MASSSFDIDAPRWDQSTFMGRLNHFFNITDWRTVTLPDSRLDEAKALVDSCRAGSVPPGTTEEQLHYAKKLYDSAFHPDTGDRMNLIGRMSFQVPGGMAITGFMLQFYRTVPAVVFWQWVNQSFNALVNYTNRNAASPHHSQADWSSLLHSNQYRVSNRSRTQSLHKESPSPRGSLGSFCRGGFSQLC
ncbi:hypothetical protein CesoFtcFv8_022269 [Champsocephalus esox]|uniref:Sideroflexin 2 n=1 Tax=Champsocephalus esox TaxID=159716 RepID=A0AAN8BAV0_9TELE|nr:hypothetical protein CesoFtcFv8_022269 [Champsocephalus esox]